MQSAETLREVRPSYIRAILRAATAPGMLSLAGGLPPESGFPLHLLKALCADIPTHPELFQYGDSRGYEPLREFLRSHDRLAPDQDLMITSGSQQGLDLVARTFLNAGDCVAMEAPSYLGAIQVFQLAGARLRLVEQTDAGPDLSQLEHVFRQDQPRFFYAVPDFHNPTGCCWTLETRREVAQLCRRYDVALIEDAPYRLLRFQGVDLAMVSTFCPERALVLRSASKVALPALRLASLSGPRAWLPQIELVKQSTDLHTGVPMQALLLGLLSHPQFDQHLTSIRQLYAGRYRALANGLAQGGLICSEVCGGMFTWVRTGDIRVQALAQQCLERNVAVVPGDAFYPSKASGCQALRLNFTYLNEAQLSAAARVISEQFHQVQGSSVT